MRTALVMTHDGPRHFGAIAILRADKVGADKQQNNISALQMLVEFFFPFYASIEVGIAPDFDQAQSLQGHKVFFQMLQHLLVFASIATEYFEWGGHRELPAFIEIWVSPAVCAQGFMRNAALL